MTNVIPTLADVLGRGDRHQRERADSWRRLCRDLDSLIDERGEPPPQAATEEEQ